MLSEDVTVFVKNEHSDDVKMDKVFSCKWCNFIKKTQKKPNPQFKVTTTQLYKEIYGL